MLLAIAGISPLRIGMRAQQHTTQILYVKRPRQQPQHIWKPIVSKFDYLLRHEKTP